MLRRGNPPEPRQEGQGGGEPVARPPAPPTGFDFAIPPPGASGRIDLPPPPPSTPPPRRSAAQSFQTEFPFTLPRGFVDRNGNVHKEGTMRLATARDELLPTFDDTVKRHPPYLTVLLLSRVVTKLGELGADDITPQVMESLFAADLAFLQDLYRRINSEGTTRAVVTCPSCHEEISVDVAGGRLGES
jgi:hypothetical protein